MILSYASNSSDDKITATITIIEYLITVSLVGHTTFLNSDFTPLKYLPRPPFFYSVLGVVLVAINPPYLVSLCVVCSLQNLQYFFSSNLSVVCFLFLYVT